jgi:hypothetical protein
MQFCQAAQQQQQQQQQQYGMGDRQTGGRKDKR